MRLIRSKNTKPESVAFRLLDAAGFRFEPHAKVDRITVDALIERRVVLFIDSPFWHVRDPADLDRLSEDWRRKLMRNRRRDRIQVRLLRALGYCVVRVWADEVAPGSFERRIRHAVARARNYGT